MAQLRTFFIFCIVTSAYAALAQDLSRQGGDLTTDSPGRFALQLPAPNVTDEARRQLQLSGFTPFHQIVTAAQGLGPTFVNSSCGGCHVENGRGPLKTSSGRFGGTTFIVKLGLTKTNPNGSPKSVPGLGLQLHDQAVKGRSNASVSLAWRTIRGKYKDGQAYSLRRPVVNFRFRKQNRRKFVSSMRMTPAVIGPGLLEAIPDSVILERHDPDDANGDGISGKINTVPNKLTGMLTIGRFGFKASNPTLAQQTAAALFFDIGVTSSIFPDLAGAPPEESDDDLNRLVVYQAIAGVPRARDTTNPAVQAGQALFFSLGCEACHRVNMTTGTAVDPELSNQLIHPYTDLLLHDMGSGLADKLSDFSARGAEWRTSPLWGLGFAESVSTDVKDLYLHDGRARTLEEAIIWHGGEAQKAKDDFLNLPKAGRDQLVAFLRSL
jgi:CxxC motif-containing protein (DUF1111 family)